MSVGSEVCRVDGELVHEDALNLRIVLAVNLRTSFRIMCIMSLLYLSYV